MMLALDIEPGRPIKDLGTRECRWPVNDAHEGELHLFCGSRKERGKPYCMAHCRLAYRPVSAVNIRREASE